MKYQAVLPLAPPLSRREKAALVLEMLESPLAERILLRQRKRLLKLLRQMVLAVLKTPSSKLRTPRHPRARSFSPATEKPNSIRRARMKP